MKLREITNCIERFAPLNLQESYDNSGLLIGSHEDEVNKALICLDITPEVIQEAIDEKCDLVISHHPLIFSGVKKIATNSLIYKAIRNNIAIYAAHTNLDSASFGVSTVLAEKLGLKNIRPLTTNINCEKCGLGSVGEFEQPMSETDFLDLVKKICKTNVIRHSAFLGQKIKKVALCGGSGREFIVDALAQNADAYLTAELKYNDFCTYETPIFLGDVGHYESEQFAVDILFEEIRKNFTTFALQKSKVNTNFVFYR